MTYTKTNWQNSPSTNTPLNADNLNHIEQGIADIYDAVNTTVFAEKTATSYGDYTDFNDINLNGAYLVNSNMTNGPLGSNSIAYQGMVCVFTWNHNNTFGMAQIYISKDSEVYSREKYGTWGAWVKLAGTQESFCERTYTNTVYTDFNAITDMGAYLVNSSLTNGYKSSELASYAGALEVFHWNHTNSYGLIQVFCENTSNNIYYRNKWGNTWSGWALIAKQTDLVPLQNEIDSQANKLDDIVVEKSINLLNPAQLENTDWYYDFSDGETVVQKTTVSYSISEMINTGLTNYIFIRQIFSNDSTAIIGLYCYSDEEYLGYANGARYSEIMGNSLRISVPSGTTKIRIYTNTGIIHGEQLCITTDEQSAFVSYSPHYEIKETAIPDNVISKKLYGKKIVNFGDSIFGIKQAPDDISTKLANITGADVYNCAFGGCRMAKHQEANWDAFSMYRLAYAVANNDFTLQDSIDIDEEGMPSYFKANRTRLESIDFSKVDIVTIAYGTNDFTANNVYLDDDSDSDNTDTFGGALRYSLEILWAAYPNIKIFVCTPTYRFWLEQGVFVEDSDTKTNLRGNTLIDFVNKCKAISNEYKITCIDNYFALGINKQNRTYYFNGNDGTHQNVKGSVIIAEHMANELF